MRAGGMCLFDACNMFACILARSRRSSSGSCALVNTPKLRSMCLRSATFHPAISSSPRRFFMLSAEEGGAVYRWPKEFAEGLLLNTSGLGLSQLLEMLVVVYC